MKNNGLLIAGALIMAALYILGEEDKPFSVTFTLEALPAVLRNKIELFSDGLLVTATRISKSSDFEVQPLTNKQFEGIVVNKLMTAFGKHEKFPDNQ